jgi:hypothetical protein
MFRDREEMRRRLRGIIERFRQKGATNPEKAMTIQEPGLPPRFEEAMHRRLGQSGIFVEINGKYYLNEERLRQIQEQRGKVASGDSGRGGWNRARPPTWSASSGLCSCCQLELSSLSFCLTLSSSRESTSWENSLSFLWSSSLRCSWPGCYSGGRGGDIAVRIGG